jgi:hypothetical protein
MDRNKLLLFHNEGHANLRHEGKKTHVLLFEIFVTEFTLGGKLREFEFQLVTITKPILYS